MTRVVGGAAGFDQNLATVNSHASTKEPWKLSVSDTEVIIVGAGIGGSTAALALQKFNIQVKVYERATELAEVGAGISLGPNATKVLETLGLGGDLEKFGDRPESLCGKHFETGEIIFNVATEDYKRQYGSPYFQLHRADLHALLIKALTLNDVDALQLGHEFVSFDEDDSGVEAIFANGVRIRGSVLVGCDGIKSILRGKLWGQTTPKFMGYIAYRGLTSVSSLASGLIHPASDLSP